MRHREFRLFFMIAALSGLLMLAGCAKKVAKATPRRHLRRRLQLQLWPPTPACFSKVSRQH